MVDGNASSTEVSAPVFYIDVVCDRCNAELGGAETTREIQRWMDDHRCPSPEPPGPPDPPITDVKWHPSVPTRAELAAMSPSPQPQE